MGLSVEGDKHAQSLRLRPGEGSCRPNWGSPGDRDDRGIPVRRDPARLAAAQARPRHTWIGRLAGDRTDKSDLAQPSPRRYGPLPELVSNCADAEDRELPPAHEGLDSLGAGLRVAVTPVGIEHVDLSSRWSG